MCEYTGPRKGLPWLSHQGKCDECRAESWLNYEPPNITFGAVPGGTLPASFSKWYARKFQKDMDAYKGAVDNGLDPENITTEAVEEAEKVAYGALPEWHRLQS